MLQVWIGLIYMILVVIGSGQVNVGEWVLISVVCVNVGVFSRCIAYFVVKSDSGL